MRLSGRLRAVAGLVSGETLADIGCDHGLLPAYLLQKGLISHAIAVDLRPGPLESARKNLSDMGLLSRAELRMGDGLVPIRPGEAQVCVIAGMGGMTITEILSASPDVAQSFRQLILAPERDTEALRRYLHENRFRIGRERMVRERGHFYNILDVSPGEDVPYGRLGYAFGETLLAARDAVLMAFLMLEEEKCERILSGLAPGQAPEKLSVYAALCREALVLYGGDGPDAG